LKKKLLMLYYEELARFELTVNVKGLALRCCYKPLMW
jgi:hypothetical protein